MEEKDQFQKKAIAYLLGELNEEESLELESRLLASKDLSEEFESLKNVLKLASLKSMTEKTNLDAEWQHFEESKIKHEYPNLFVREAERFGNDVIKQLHFKRSTRLLRAVSTISIAASLILAISWGWSLLNKAPKNKQAAISNQEVKVPTVVPQMRKLVNNSAEKKQYSLPDGTHIILYGNSELSFREPFESSKRDLQLTGRALFNVAKDKSRPFTVYSNDISTTAIGTSFTVMAPRNSKRVRVSLHEGKVVVKGGNGLIRILTKNYYLLPGQEFVFDGSKPHAIVRVINVPEIKGQKQKLSSRKLADERAGEDVSIPDYGKGTWFMFNNQPLDEVFEQLKDMYKTEIIYTKSEVSKLYFIGTFNRKDSLEQVLTQIVAVYKLKMDKENDHYIISKK